VHWGLRASCALPGALRARDLSLDVVRGCTRAPFSRIEAEDRNGDMPPTQTTSTLRTASDRMIGHATNPMRNDTLMNRQTITITPRPQFPPESHDSYGGRCLWYREPQSAAIHSRCRSGTASSMTWSSADSSDRLRSGTRPSGEKQSLHLRDLRCFLQACRCAAMVTCHPDQRVAWRKCYPMSHREMISA